MYELETRLETTMHTRSCVYFFGSNIWKDHGYILETALEFKWILYIHIYIYIYYIIYVCIKFIIYWKQHQLGNLIDVFVRNNIRKYNALFVGFWKHLRTLWMYLLEMALGNTIHYLLEILTASWMYLLETTLRNIYV